METTTRKRKRRKQKKQLLAFVRYPLFSIAIALSSGIALQHRLSLSPFFILLLISTTTLFLFFVLRKFRTSLIPTKGIHHSALAGYVLLFVSIGMFLLMTRQLYYAEDHSERGEFLVRTLDRGTPKGSRIRYEAQLLTASARDNKIRSQGISIWLYLDSTQQTVPTLGHTFRIKGSLLVPKNRTDSAAFDFRRYCRTRGLRFMLFANRRDSLRRVDTQPGQDLRLWSALQRDRLSTELQRLYPDPQNFGIASSMLLGDKSHLSEESKEHFRKSGLAHLLAVSGLHVGILSALITMLLSFIPRNSRLYPIRPLLIIAFTWFYVALIGFPASAVRAAVMISTYLIANLTGRINQGTNSLFLAIILLLATNPYTLFDIGFQLSVAATFGILLIIPQLSDLPIHRYPSPVRYGFNLCALSISAQLFTLPLTLYYFRSFPLLFLPANLVVLPFISILLYGTILLLVLQGLGIPIDYPAIAMNTLFGALSRFTEWIASIS